MAVIACPLMSWVAFALSLKAAFGTVYTVGFNNAPVWTVGIGVSYPDITITLGSTLSFVASNMHDVVLVHPPASGTPWDLCSMNGIPSTDKTTVFATSDFAATNTDNHYTPPTCGDFFLACSVPPHCAYGQRVKVTVVNAGGGTCTSPCAGASCVTSDSKLVVSASQNVHGVSPSLPAKYWGIAFYDDLVVNIGDSVLFKTGAGHHDVATVPDAGAFSSCDMTAKTTLAEWDYSTGNISASCTSSSSCCTSSSCGVESMFATFAFTAMVAGDVHFVCSVGGSGHCQQGQKFKVTVRAAPTDRAGTASNAPNNAHVCLSALMLAACAFLGLWL